MNEIEKSWREKIYLLYGHGGIRKRLLELMKQDLKNLEVKK